MQIEILRNPSQLLGLREEWQKLLQTSAHSVFLNWDYLTNWLDLYGENAEIRVFLARNSDGSLLGVAPMEIANSYQWSRRYLRTLTFLGCQCEVVTEYGDFLVPEENKAEVIPAFCRAIHNELEGEWDLLSLPNLTPDSTTADMLNSEWAQLGYELQTFAEDSAYYIPFSESWEDYLRSRSKNFRKKLRNRHNRLHNTFGQIEVREAGVDLSFDEAFDVLIALNEKRWDAEERASFATEAFISFHRQLIRQLQDKGQIGLFVLRIDGQDVAAQYDYLYDGKVWGYQGGWLPEFGEHHVGRYLLASCMERYHERGFSEYDFLPGDAEYKRSWTSDRRELIKLEAINPQSQRALIFHATKELRNMIRLPFFLAGSSS